MSHENMDSNDKVMKISENLELLRIHNELIKKECEDQRTITEKTLLQKHKGMINFIAATWRIKSSTNMEEFLKLQNAGALQDVIFKHSTLTIYVPKNNLMKMTRHVGTKLVDEQQFPVGAAENGKLLYIWGDFIKIITEHSTEKIWLENEQLHVSNEKNGVRCERIYEKEKLVANQLVEERNELEKRIQSYQEVEKTLEAHHMKWSEILRTVTGVWEKLERQPQDFGSCKNKLVTNEPRTRLILKFDASKKLWCQSSDSNSSLEHCYELGEHNSKKMFVAENSIIIKSATDKKYFKKFYVKDGLLHLIEYDGDSIYRRIAADGFYWTFYRIPKKIQKIAKNFEGAYETLSKKNNYFDVSFNLVQNPPTFTTNSETLRFGYSHDTKTHLYIKDGCIEQLKLDKYMKIEKKDCWKKEGSDLSHSRQKRSSINYDNYQKSEKEFWDFGKLFGGCFGGRRGSEDEHKKPTNCGVIVIS